ncbi:MAG: glycoside hydrolase family 26 protein [Eubacterium sp.]|jgi:mannan endo-1,4-beta-mannosidase|nr:glycoside hydrolase family 26 protein [Eubacterium sp.]
MKKVLLFLISFNLLIAGCAKDIEYPDVPPVYSDDSGGKPVVEHPVFSERRRLDYGLTSRLFEYVLNAAEEFPEKESADLYEIEEEKYIKLSDGSDISFDVDSPSSQHYVFDAEIFANGSALGIYSGETEHGAFYAGVADSFNRYVLKPVYLREGKNTITLAALRGDVYLRSVEINNIDLAEIGLPPAGEGYSTEIRPANPNATEKAKAALEYLAGVYGKNTLTMQHCTVNTNVEINAIYEATGRYPAIRAGDMINYSRCYGGGDKKDNKEIELTKRWTDYGGLAMLSWTWYSPLPAGGSHYYMSNTDFNIDNAVSEHDITLMDLERMTAMNEAGLISDETLELTRDIDDMANNLKVLAEQNIPLLWRPLKEPELKWYWWGAGKPASYIYVWRLMFDRFSRYHGLDNLIWVWSGENELYYPGNGYVDIVGVDCYNLTDSSNAIRFDKAAEYAANGKLVSMTECGLLPNPDILYRDNAMWLFFGLYKGDYLVGDNGLHASAYNLKDRLEYVYNHELTIALDELIDF